MMDSNAISYFQSVNPICRKIVQETNMVQDYFSENWKEFGEKRQDDILDDYFVPPDVRAKYQNCEKINSYINSYPVLKIRMGEKIVVDEANDFWTWQDEFSGPFSWKSKSQQDLTLLDLEPEQMTKQSKTRRRNSRDLSEEDNKTEREFPVQDPEKSLWNSDFKNIKQNEFKSSLNKDKPDTELFSQKNGTVKTDNSPEEINYAFSRDSFIDTCDQKNVSGKNSVNGNLNENTEVHNTTLNTSVSKRKHDIEMSVFENPMMSDVIEEDDLSRSSSPSHKPLLNGYESSNTSPSRKPLLKGDSQDSSYSLKSDSQVHDHDERVTAPVTETNDKSQLVSSYDYEDTELIAVDVNTGSSMLNDSHGSMSSLNLPKTGFDFLDQW